MGLRIRRYIFALWRFKEESEIFFTRASRGLFFSTKRFFKTISRFRSIQLIILRFRRAHVQSNFAVSSILRRGQPQNCFLFRFCSLEFQKIAFEDFVDATNADGTNIIPTWILLAHLCGSWPRGGGDSAAIPTCIKYQQKYIKSLSRWKARNYLPTPQGVVGPVWKHYCCWLWHTPLYDTVALAQCWIEIELLKWTLNWLARLNWIGRLLIEFSSGFFNRSFTWRFENTLACDMNSRFLHALASRNSQFTL